MHAQKYFTLNNCINMAVILIIIIKNLTLNVILYDYTYNDIQRLIQTNSFFLIILKFIYKTIYTHFSFSEN